MGTRFMATEEAAIHQDIKTALVEGKVGGTELVMRGVKNTERVYKNAVSSKVREIEAEFPGDFPKIHELVKGENYRKSFQETGDAQSSVWSCGESMCLIDDVPTVKVLMESMIAEAEESIRASNSMLQ
jgi:NAD(P)H-dependent flavin oxidoreductase YrpB (nitropropane dioxygenase family)